MYFISLYCKIYYYYFLVCWVKIMPKGWDFLFSLRFVTASPPRVCIIVLIIQRPVVNYSAYTTVATPQDIDQIIYFKAFVRFFYLNRYCE